MLDTRQVRTVMDRVARFEQPVLSMYVANMSSPVDHRELLTRVKSTLDSVDLDPSVRDRALKVVEEDPPSAAAVGVFVDGRGDAADVVRIPSEGGLGDARSGRGLLTLGEPFLTPLWAAVRSRDHYAALYVDGDLWRLFRLTDVEAEELESDQRIPTAAERDTKENSKQVSRNSTPDRSDAHVDRMQDNLSEDRKRFFDDAAERLMRILPDYGLTQLLLVGLEEATASMEKALRARRNQWTMARCSGPPHSSDSPMEIHGLLKEPMNQLRRQRQESLMREIQEKGEVGPAAVLKAWQHGRLRTVMISYPNDLKVWRMPGESTVALSKDDAGRHRPDAEPVSVRFDAILPELAESFDVEVELVRSELKEELDRRMEGMAGLVRW